MSRHGFKPAKYYENRAVEAQAVSKTMHNQSNREAWENIAKGYQALAEVVDQIGYDLEQRTLAALKATPQGQQALLKYGDEGDRDRQCRREVS